MNKLKEKKTIFLSHLFHHLDGIALIPTITSLESKKILSDFRNTTLSSLAKKHDANIGYLHVALRLLCSQGILTQKIRTNNDVDFIINENKVNFEKIIKTYEIVTPLYSEYIDYSLLISQSNENQVSNSQLFKTIQQYLEKYELNKKKSLFERHVEGAILGPIIVTLSMHGCFNNLDTNNWSKSINIHWKKNIHKLFLCCGIIETNGVITDYGLFILKRASSYGVTVSYLPTFRNIKNLLFGDYTLLLSGNGEEEKHVDRAMNVWGSGGAHNTYFKKVDKIILDLFNLPIQQQPKGFIDIGCGNGKLIEHIFDLIYYQTKRGKQLNKHPLFIVGSDFNYKALQATKETINKADIWAKTAFGDISDPKNLAERLKKEHQINLEDLLNVRSFLDHNRIYSKPKNPISTISNSTGAFCQKGQKINNSLLQQNLKEHLEKWYPYLKKYGLLIVELHTINPKIAMKKIGKTAITAYDASHGFSDQYIIEYDCFLTTAKEVGLIPDPIHEYTFPSREIPIVSINRLIKMM